MFMVLLLGLSLQQAIGQSVFGTWQTIDDRTGVSKALIEIFQKDGLMYGEVQEILEEGREEALCTKCKGKRKGRPIEGMQIIEALEKTGPYTWEGDTLFDPEQGRTFRCKIWLDPERPNELKVRGYLMFIYRTQTWKRASNPS